MWWAVGWPAKPRTMMIRQEQRARERRPSRRKDVLTGQTGDEHHRVEAIADKGVSIEIPRGQISGQPGRESLGPTGKGSGRTRVIPPRPGCCWRRRKTSKPPRFQQDSPETARAWLRASAAECPHAQMRRQQEVTPEHGGGEQRRGVVRINHHIRREKNQQRHHQRESARQESTRAEGHGAQGTETRQPGGQRSREGAATPATGICQAMSTRKSATNGMSRKAGHIRGRALSIGFAPTRCEQGAGKLFSRLPVSPDHRPGDPL